MVILDGHGKELVCSDGPRGNGGYPLQPYEIEHFLTMLRSTTTRIDEKQLAEIKRALDEYRERRNKG